MDMEKFGELMKAKLGSFPEFEGICYPLAHPFREKGAEKVLQDIFHIQSSDSDIMICTYPKSGEIGSWKNHFTVAQNERFDKQYTERFKDSTYKLTFE